MTEELKKQGGAIDTVVANMAEEADDKAAAVPELDEATKVAAEREARRQALYEENERAEDERARAEAERMRDEALVEDDTARDKDTHEQIVRRLTEELNRA